MGYHTAAKGSIDDNLRRAVVYGTVVASFCCEGFGLNGKTKLPEPLEEISIDPLALAFAACVSLVTGLLFGLVPVYRYARPAVSTELRSGGRSVTGQLWAGSA